MEPKRGRLIPLASIPKKRMMSTGSKILDAFAETWEEAKDFMARDVIAIGQAYSFMVPQEFMGLPIGKLPDSHTPRTLKACARPVKKFVKMIYKDKYVVRTRTTPEGPTILICRPGPL